jgi:acetyl-CoA C-acetyltransferase
MNQAFICDAIRTPFGRYGGALSSVRADDLAAVPLKALMARNPNVDWLAVTDLIYGCVNQAGEDNRNVAHMASLLAGLPMELPGATINRLCGSGMDAIGTAARAIKSGEATMMIAGGVESMSRAPFVMPKAESAFSRSNTVYDTTIGWRFINKLMKEKYGVDSMPETAENVATDFHINREDQDKMALASQMNKRVTLTLKFAPSPFPRKRAMPWWSAKTSTHAPPAWSRWPNSNRWFAPMAR